MTAVVVTRDVLQPCFVCLKSKEIELGGGGSLPTTDGICTVAKVWWHLQDPEAVHETYKKGQHLKGMDAANAERVRAEMVSILSSAIPCHALNPPLPCFTQLSLCCTAFWTALRLHYRCIPAQLG